MCNGILPRRIIMTFLRRVSGFSFVREFNTIGRNRTALQIVRKTARYPYPFLVHVGKTKQMSEILSKEHDVHVIASSTFESETAAAHKAAIFGEDIASGRAEPLDLVLGPLAFGQFLPLWLVRYEKGDRPLSGGGPPRNPTPTAWPLSLCESKHEDLRLLPRILLVDDIARPVRLPLPLGWEVPADGSCRPTTPTRPTG